MEFTCTHCHKPIYTVAIILDKTHFIHEGCIDAYNNAEKQKEEEVVEKWEKSGLLTGLKRTD